MWHTSNAQTASLIRWETRCDKTHDDERTMWGGCEVSTATCTTLWVNTECPMHASQCVARTCVSFPCALRCGFFFLPHPWLAWRSFAVTSNYSRGVHYYYKPSWHKLCVYYIRQFERKDGYRRDYNLLWEIIRMNVLANCFFFLYLVFTLMMDKLIWILRCKKWHISSIISFPKIYLPTRCLRRRTQL